MGPWVARHRRLARGEARGIERLLLPALFPAALLYGAGVWLRDRVYAHGLRQTVRLDRPLISVGGLSAGGSGKTPFAAYLARLVCCQGRRPLLVAHGYGAPRARRETRLLTTGAAGEALREPWRTAGEEAVLMTRLAPGVPVVIARRRAEALTAARREGLDPEVVIVDGGFQDRRLQFDLRIVLLDAACRPGGGFLLPLGDRREGWRSLERADLVVLHRAELCHAHAEWESFLARLQPSLPILWCENRLGEPYVLGASRPADLQPMVQGWGAGRRWGIWTGLGHPEAFVAALESHGLELAWVQLVRDHAVFEAAAADLLARTAADLKLDGFLITEKDAIKLEPFAAELPPVYVLPAALDLGPGRSVLEYRLAELLASTRA